MIIGMGAVGFLRDIFSAIIVSGVILTCLKNFVFWVEKAARNSSLGPLGRPLLNLHRNVFGKASKFNFNLTHILLLTIAIILLAVAHEQKSAAKRLKKRQKKEDKRREKDSKDSSSK